jgi:diguanylate cyclase (GGDEF)-like protein/PAS domain S-box-containing protein
MTRRSGLIAAACIAVLAWGAVRYGTDDRELFPLWIAGLPVVLLAWGCGMRGVAVYLLASLAAQGLLALASSHVGLTPADMIWSLVLLVVSLAIGWLRDRVDRSERKLQAAELRYDRALRESGDVLWEWEIASGSAFFSASFAGLLGCPASELTARATEWLDRVHPDDLEALNAALDACRRGEARRFSHLHRLRRKDGTYVWVSTGGQRSGGQAGEPVRLTGWISDVTDQRRSAAQLRRLALQDPLTGLPNRVLLMERLEKAHERALRKQGEYAVLLVDLDRFKIINDSLGPATGDLLLMKVARLLRSVIGPNDTIARLGGDEFVVLLEDLSSFEQAEALASQILGTLTQPIEVDGQRVVVGASVGLSRGTGAHGRGPDEVLREADIAMYQAKSQGGERVDRFDPGSQPDLAERLDLENELRRALDGETLQVHYQPIVDLEAGIVVGFEALSRWQHPRLGFVSPAKFIPIAEEAGLIARLGECVLRRACRDAASLRQTFPDAQPFRMGVNLSVAQLGSVDLAERVKQILAEHGLGAEYLSLEITESGLLEDTEGASRIFTELQAMGVRLAMDDFGTGYSSLQYLRRFRIDTLKIDGSFVRDLEHTAGEEICASVINLGRDLGLSVVAEGVERPEELARLLRLGGRYAQGFLFSRPLAFEDLLVWLESKPRWRFKMAS